MFTFHRSDNTTKRAVVLYDYLKRISDVLLLSVIPHDSKQLKYMTARVYNVLGMCNKLCDDYLYGRLQAISFIGAVAGTIKLIRFQMIYAYIQDILKSRCSDNVLETTINKAKDCYIWIKELTEDNLLYSEDSFYIYDLDKAMNELSPKTCASIEDALRQGKCRIYVKSVSHHVPETYS